MTAKIGRAFCIVPLIAVGAALRLGVACAEPTAPDPNDGKLVLTGTEEQIAAVVKECRVFVEFQPGGGDYIVNHGSFYYLINPEGKFVRVIAGDVSGEELAERLRHWINKTV